MKTNRLTVALALSDRDLLGRIDALAATERETTADLVAHLLALELRPSVYASEGYGSLFAYCTEALRLSEDAAWNRVEAVRACRDYPVVLDLLGSGSLTLTAVRMLRKHLTKENHEVVLARARHQKKAQIEALVAELAPKPDVIASVRKMPTRTPMATSLPEGPPTVPALALKMGPQPESQTDAPAGAGQSGDEDEPLLTPAPTHHRVPRALVQALAPGRYRVQFTIGQETHDKLRRLQALLRREVPNGDAGLIFERFVDVLLDKVEGDKLGKRERPRKSSAGRQSVEARSAGAADESRSRSGTTTHPRGAAAAPLHRAQFPGGAPHPSTRPGRPANGREPLAPVPAAQPVRGGARFPALPPKTESREECQRKGGPGLDLLGLGPTSTAGQAAARGRGVCHPASIRTGERGAPQPSANP
jgi:hypothetical protein